MSQNTPETDDLGSPVTLPTEAQAPARDAEPIGGAREINVFSMDYRGSGMDFRPQPVGYDVPDTLPGESEPAPKDSSVAESAASSAELDDVIPTPEEAAGPEQEMPTPAPTPQPPMHPSQLQAPVTTASAEKDSGQPKAPAASKQTSSEDKKTG